MHLLVLLQSIFRTSPPYFKSSRSVLTVFKHMENNPPDLRSDQQWIITSLLLLVNVQVDVFVPPTVSPGNYKGQVTVQSSSGDYLQEISLPFSVQVWSATLPSMSEYATEFGFDIHGAMKAQFGKDVYNTTMYRNLTKLYLDAALMHKV